MLSNFMSRRGSLLEPLDNQHVRSISSSSSPVRSILFLTLVLFLEDLHPLL